DKCLPTGADLVGARVDELTLEQLRTIDVGTRTLASFPGQRQAPGARIPTLGEVLALGSAHAPGVWWTIELKIDPTEPRVADTRSRMLDGVVAAVEVAGTGSRSLVHSFDWAVLELARERVPHLQRSALAVHGVTYAPGSPWLGGLEWGDHGDDDLPGAAQAIGAHVVAPHHHSVDRALVARAHALGLGVLPWTVNEPEDLRRVLDAGVDGVVTDYPGRALALTGVAATGSRADALMA
ncbi:glycerophosphodiester phosphodiesterase family protein, partial [Intrasporangium sp.]|uniref:glycerophosphodiester phosphodiesterase family protein n=1 Tax=Intrasporangium sp. TaxID=1925024 RepID=UPI002939F0FD